MVLELVIGIIRKGIKSTILMHTLIFDNGFQEKSQKLFPIFSDFCIISHVLPPKNHHGPRVELGNNMYDFLDILRILKM